MEYDTFIFALLSSILISDATILWRIDVNHPIYLLGTAHLPYTEIWSNISDTAKSAFKNSTHFFAEFDMTNFFKFTQLRMCLNAALPPRGNGPLPLPPTVGFTGQGGPPAPILDVYLLSKARRSGKIVDSLESVDTYCEFTKFQATSMMPNSNTPPLPDQNIMQNVKLTYNCDFNCRGELFPPVRISIEDKILLDFKQRLEAIVNLRDTQMAEKIDQLIKGTLPDDRLFIAVGFNHLMGPASLVIKLREHYKYSVTRLCTDPHDFRTTLSCQGPSWCDPILGL